MSFVYGDELRIKIGDGASTEAFVQIGGEVSFDQDRTSKEIDLATKDDGAYESKGYASQTVAFNVTGKLKLPDAGFTRVSAVSKTLPPVCNWEVTRGGVVLYAGQVAVGNLSISAPHGDVVSYKFTATASQAPTVDNLSATS